MVDPIRLGEIVKAKFCAERDGIFYRRYWRFRGGLWYGGIATADCVGCNLRCKFCGPRICMSRKGKYGSLKSPEEVANILLSIAQRRGYRYLRISGGEPTICFQHLLQVIDRVKTSKYVFILETNGIILGIDGSYAEQLSRYPNIHVRVSIKGTNPQEFSTLTMAPAQYFEYQIRALENLLRYEVSFHPAVVASFTTSKNIEKLRERLWNIDPTLAENLEIEYIVLYPHVIESLNRHNLIPTKAYTTRWRLIDSEEYRRRYLREKADKGS